MKKIILDRGKKEERFLYLGTAREICSLYNNLKKRDIAHSTFSNKPKFNMFKCYGLMIECYDVYTEEYFQTPQMEVWKSDSCLSLLFQLR